MPDKTLKQIDVLRHELKALRYILDNFHAGKLPPAALPPREDFLSAQAREIYDIDPESPRAATRPRRRSPRYASTTSTSSRSCA